MSNLLNDNRLKQIFNLIKTNYYLKSDTQSVTTIDIDDVPTSGSNNLVTSMGIYDALQAKQSAATSQTITIAVADWSSGTTCTKSVTGVTATNIVIVDTSDGGVECTAQGTGTLTFTATSTPTSAVTVKVVIL